MCCDVSTLCIFDDVDYSPFSWKMLEIEVVMREQNDMIAHKSVIFCYP